MQGLQRQEVQELIGRGAQVVEVLSPDQFEEDHIPGAVNIRLRDIDREAVTRLDQGTPVIVYCWDSA